ncbi:hypothetical protein ABW20_dc0103004 [Dactylellina cionopaga]|nr:hypothetical protein ABW20_dc0103004 [Dactylellina cionopaga]
MIELDYTLPPTTIITRKAVLRHKDTLEVFWLEIIQPRSRLSEKLPLDLGPHHERLDWLTITSGEFRRLREVAVNLSPNAFLTGVVGNDLEVLRVLNFQDFDIFERYSAQYSLMSGFVERMFELIRHKQKDSKLQVLAFGSPNSAHLKSSIFFLGFVQDFFGREVIKCTEMDVRQAQYFLPETIILGANSRFKDPPSIF